MVKIKNHSLSCGVLVLIAATCLPLFISRAASAIPVNTVVPLTYGNAANYCTVWFQHGEAYGGAYAKFKGVAGHCDPGTEVQVFGDNFGSNFPGPRCGLWKNPWGNGCSVTQGSTQSFLAPYHTLKFSRVTLCSNGVSPYCKAQLYGR